MPYTKISLQLTEEQRLAIRTVTGDPAVNKFSVLAQPYVESGRMTVYVLTQAQTQIVNPAIAKAQKENAYIKSD